MRVQAGGLAALLSVVAVDPPEATALSLNRGVEAPPAIYASGPSLSGRTYVIAYSDPAQVDYICRLGIGEPPRRGGTWWGCYRADMDAIIAPAQGSWAESERRRILAHEWAHARGWRHNPDGRGTSQASLPPPGSATVIASTSRDEFPITFP